MFKLVIQKIISKNIKNNFFGKPITEEELQPIIKEIRISLLNSDVNLTVIKNFLIEIKDEILSEKKLFFNKKEAEVAIFKVIKEKLIKILGNQTKDLLLKKTLNKFLLIGTNGSGKTTTAGKLSFLLKNKKNLKVKCVNLDIYRPGAFDQLNKLVSAISVDCFQAENNNFEMTINKTLETSYLDNTEVIIYDTAGIIPNDENQLKELKKLKELIKPDEIIYVLDAMAGQESLDILEIFHKNLVINSLIISKSDSSSPMGAAFSAVYLFNIPIKFLGSGEKIEDLTPFYVDRIAGQILCEGDILSLAEKIDDVVDEQLTKKSLHKMMSGKFDLNDLILQYKEIKKLGSFKSIFKFLPNMKMDNLNLNAVDGIEEEFKKWEILISSMTKKERKNPKLFKKEPNRKIRVIKGSGRKPDELNKLLKKWEDGKKKLEEMSKKFSSNTGAFPFF